MLALRLMLKDKGCKQHCWPFAGFWKRGNMRKGLLEIEDWGTSVYLVSGFQENSMQSLSAFWLFFGYKRNCKSITFFLFFLFLDHWIFLISLTMAHIRGEYIH